MLEQKDLQAIAEIIDSRVGVTEEKINKSIGTLGEKIEALEETTGTFGEKIEALEETTGTFGEKIEALEETTRTFGEKIEVLEETTGTLGEKIEVLEETTGTLCGKIEALEEKIVEVERSLVNELVRTEDILNRRIEEVKNNMDELNQYYRITKLENNNTGLLLEMLEKLQKRIEELERKIA